MTTLYVDDFKLGLDTRKSALTAEPGSLQTLENCVITPGGEIQKRKAFVPVATVNLTTHGMHGTTTGAFGGEELWFFDLSNQTGTAPGTNLWFGSLTLASGEVVKLLSQSLQADIATDDIAAILDVTEYGPQQFFIDGYTQTPDPNATAANPPASILRNWWKGNEVREYVGFAPLVAGQKMYRVVGSILYFSGVGDPSVTVADNPDGTPVTVNPGAGFIDLSLLDENSSWLVGLCAYYKQVAVFSRRSCLFFNLDPDPALNTLQQVLAVGAVSNRSILQFGTGDVLFLSDSGVRSLRVLNVSFAAGVTDVGSPIDSIIQQAVIDAGSTAAIVCQAVIEPLTGRYWLAIGQTIYVLSYWPSAKINAWSTFVLPFPVIEITVAGTKIFVRDNKGNIYLYGGLDGITYDNSQAVVVTPFMSADTPSTMKKFQSVSAMVQGNWSMELAYTTNNPGAYELVANLAGDTYSQEEYAVAARGSHVSFRLKCTDAGPSLLGALTVRFEKAQEE